MYWQASCYTGRGKEKYHLLNRCNVFSASFTGHLQVAFQKQTMAKYTLHHPILFNFSE